MDIIALGPSQREYHGMLHANYNPPLPAPDETWAVNKGLRSVVSDLAFVLDDLEGERRHSQRYADEIINYAAQRPVITSELTNHERMSWPGLIFNYPLTEVIDHVGGRLAPLQGLDDTPQNNRAAGMQAGLYLHNSVPMILAYALLIGVKEIRLFGADYTIRGSDHMEENRPNCEYWIGMLRGFGLRVRLSGSTTLLNTDLNKRIYGYARPPILKPVE